MAQNHCAEVVSKGYPREWTLQPDKHVGQYSIMTEGSLSRESKFYGMVSNATPEALKLILYAPELYRIVAELAKTGLVGSRTVLKQAARDLVGKMGNLASTNTSENQSA